MGSRATAFRAGSVPPLVQRPRLFSILDGATTRRLTMVVAPAGYGKTSLLTEWMVSREDEAVWITIGPAHNRPGRLAADLATGGRALRGATSGIVVLDDFQRLTDHGALEECAAFIEDAPEAWHVVLSSRMDPSPRYFRLRLADQLAEIQAVELAFTREEAAGLLPHSQVDAVLACTRGWAFGVGVAAAGLREDDDVEEFFRGDDRIDGYLTTEVLDAQADESRTVLLASSVLDQVSGPLSDLLTSGGGGQVTLEDLETSGAFVSSVDARREWFVLHPLFRDVLRRRVSDSDRSALLHRAAEWHLERGDIDDGVRCLIDAGATDEVVEAGFTYGPALLDQQRVSDVAGWVEGVSFDAGGGIRPRLLEAGSLLFGGAPAAARRVLDDLATARSALEGERIVADLLRAFVALTEGLGREAAVAAQRVLDAIDSVQEADLPNVLGLTGTRVDVAGGAHVARGTVGLFDGRLSAARWDLEAVSDEAHGRWRASALGCLSLVEAWSGNLTKGDELAGQALSLADELGHDAPARSTAWLALALVARRREEFGRAEALLDALELTGATQRRAVGIWVATERALLALAANGATAAAAVLGGRQASPHPSMPDGVLAQRRAAEAHVLVASDQLEAAQAALDDGFGGESSETMAARTRVALSRGDTTSARALLDDWPQEAQPRAGRAQRLWASVLDHLEGRAEPALTELAAVASEAEREGDIELFALAGSLATGPIRALYCAAPSPFLRSLVERQSVVAQAKPVKGLPEQLTDREYMVLMYLPTRQSNAEIAERLGVSLNTVKTHLKHVYRKLDVVGRSEAVDAAERMHLL